MVMRPKQKRFVDGIELADNLYVDPRKRPDYYQVKLPDGRMRVFFAETPRDANEIVAEAMAALASGVVIDGAAPPTREQTLFQVERYILYAEKLNPRLKQQRSWSENSVYAFRQFARTFDRMSTITIDAINVWWDGLSYHQQKQRQAAFRRMFNWFMRERIVPRVTFNPFTLSDDLPRLLVKQKPEKQRPPLTELGYRQVRKAAGELGLEALQLAMGISLYTTLREGDVCSLRFDEHVVDGRLQVVVGKSEKQRGPYHAARLSWTLAEHPRLKRLIDRARELSLANRRCPYVISHSPKRRAWNGDKQHICQVTTERLARMFADARTHAGLSGVTFHEVRGLASTLYRVAGYTTREIQHLMAHEDESTTRGYQNPRELPYEDVTMKLEVEL